LDQFKLSVKASIPAAAEQEVAATEVEPSFSVEKQRLLSFRDSTERADLDGPSRRKAREEMGAIPATPVSCSLCAGWGSCGCLSPRHSTLPGPWNFRLSLGMKNGVETAGTRRQENSAKASLEEQLSDAGHEREQLRGQIVERDQP